MIIFGIDPGTAFTGYGVVKAQNNSVSCVDAGVIATDATRPLAERPKSFTINFVKIQLHKPSRVLWSRLFTEECSYHTCSGHARGVAILAARNMAR